MKDAWTRQKVEHLSLVLTYPDGGAAEFSGSDLYADVVFETPDLPPLDVQDALLHMIAVPAVNKLTIDITLGLNGRISMQLRPS